MKKSSDRNRSLKHDETVAVPNGIEAERNDRLGWLRAISTVTFSLSLVLIMATALFVTVGINPKQQDYGKLPWVYAIVCVVGSAACRMISNRLDPDQTSEVTGE